MARYLSYKINGNQKDWFKVHSTDASKNWWNGKEPNLNFITLTEDQFSKLKYSHDFEINDSNQIILVPVPASPEGAVITGVTKSEAEEGLKKHIADMEHHVNNHSTPLFTQNDVNTLKNINLESISWPVVVTGGWVESLENNSINIDHIFEI